MIAFLQTVGFSALLILIYMTALWVVSLIRKDSSIADIFWGLGFVLVGWLSFLLSDGFLLRKVLIVSLVTVWGLRLSIHILIRNWGRGEDFRYRQWREEHGARWWWRSLFQVFWLQGAIMLVVSAPILGAQLLGDPSRLTILDVVGTMVWAVGFFFEAVGDWQLTRFKSDPANAGKLLTTGLWATTRHPNYFGDAVVWWGHYLIAAAGGGFWLIFSPILMTFLLARVSGVNMLEKTLSQTKPGYEDYIARTSAFVPWFPRRKHKLR